MYLPSFSVNAQEQEKITIFPNPVILCTQTPDPAQVGDIVRVDLLVLNPHEYPTTFMIWVFDNWDLDLINKSQPFEKVFIPREANITLSAWYKIKHYVNQDISIWIWEAGEDIGSETEYRIRCTKPIYKPNVEFAFVQTKPYYPKIGQEFDAEFQIWLYGDNKYLHNLKVELFFPREVTVTVTGFGENAYRRWDYSSDEIWVTIFETFSLEFVSFSLTASANIVPRGFYRVNALEWNETVSGFFDFHINPEPYETEPPLSWVSTSDILLPVQEFPFPDDDNPIWVIIYLAIIPITFGVIFVLAKIGRRLNRK
jgi:hypothetical protein